MNAIPSERFYKHHRRQWLLYVLFCSLMAIGTLIAVFIPGQQPDVVLIPCLIVLALMFATHLIARARNREEYAEEFRRISQDEWMAVSRRRALRLAFLTVIFSQVPLMFFMSFVPPKPSVIGMGIMTTALGCGVWAAGFLIYSRETVDE